MSPERSVEPLRIGISAATINPSEAATVRRLLAEGPPRHRAAQSKTSIVVNPEVNAAEEARHGGLVG